MHYTTPERAGIPSSAILRFLNRLEENRVCMHSFMLVKDGGILAEGYWKPFTAQFKHRMYSVSKSFVSLGVGLLAGEGKLKLEDPVAGYFPEYLPENPHPYLMEATVRDLLRMATPHDQNAYTQDSPNFVEAFFKRPPSHRPGRVFHYDTAGTVVLNALVEKLAGQPILDYLRPRLLDPLGVSADVACVQRPEGGSWGGSGVLCTAMDLAKVALCCMRGGRHEGRQLIPEWYVREATGWQIDNRTSSHNPEWQFGYGYQFWRARHGGFAMVGMGSQLAVCLPQYDFMMVTTADTQESDTIGSVIMDGLWEDIYPCLEGKCPPSTTADQEELTRRLKDLRVMPERGGLHSAQAARWSGKRFRLDDNPIGMRWIRFTFDGEDTLMEYENAQGNCSLRLGMGQVVAQPFPQKNYFGRRIGQRPGRRYDCLASAAWADESCLTAHVWISDEYLGSVKMDAVFRDDNVTLQFSKQAEWFLSEYMGFASGDVEED